MTAGYRQLTTAGGYPLNEATSALQKCIRRGMEEEALFWAQEMESRFWKYLWQRLQVISHEDIGLANPLAQVYTRLMAEQYADQRKEGKLFTLGLINTVLYLAQSPKSRHADHMLSLVYHRDYKLDIPDFALDGHTVRGKRLGRGIDFFYDEGARIHPDAGLDKVEALARAIDKDKQTRSWWTELKKTLRTPKGRKDDRETPTLF